MSADVSLPSSNRFSLAPVSCFNVTSANQCLLKPAPLQQQEINTLTDRLLLTFQTTFVETHPYAPACPQQTANHV